jgi:hypothetical protein
MPTDPFTSASTAILNALKSSSAFTTIVRAGNLIDLTSDSFEQFKGQLQFGDTPEVALLPQTFELQPFGSNSQVASLSQAYQLVATHDSLQVKPVNALKFAAMVALLQAGPDLGLSGLVRSWEITKGADDAFGHPQWRRSSQRWVSVMSIVVYMELDRSSLISTQ